MGTHAMFHINQMDRFVTYAMEMGWQRTLPVGESALTMTHSDGRVASYYKDDRGMCSPGFAAGGGPWAVSLVSSWLRSGWKTDGEAELAGKQTTITPEVARSLLATAKNIRPIVYRTVRRYADDMRKGKWRLNGEAIIIGADGALMNGFHRLTACTHAGVPFTTLVVRGVENLPGVNCSIDVGMSRSYGQQMASRKIWKGTHSAALCSGAKWLESLRNGTTAADASGTIIRTDLDREEIFVLAETSTMMHEALSFYIGKETRRIKNLLRPMGAFIGLYAHLAERDHELVSQIYAKIKYGTIGPNDPAWVIADYLAKNRQQRSQDEPKVALAKFIKGWNGIRSRRGAQILRWLKKEKFPEAL